MEFASEADRAYANSAFIPGSDAYPARWRAEAQTFVAATGGRARLGLRYGSGARHAFDLFLPEGDSRGLMVFLHGGYWMETGRGDWSHLAAGAVARGWACAIPSYTLAPEARVATITSEVAQAVRAAAALVGGPVVVTGHSAGGHLAARMGCTDGPGEVRRVVPVSPVADLRPLMQTAMNATLRLDESEAVAESPAFLGLRPDVSAHVWVGGQERPAFLWQARTLSENWNCPWTVDVGRNHFDVLDGFMHPDSPLMRACLDGL